MALHIPFHIPFLLLMMPSLYYVIMGVVGGCGQGVPKAKVGTYGLSTVLSYPASGLINAVGSTGSKRRL